LKSVAVPERRWFSGKKTRATMKRTRLAMQWRGGAFIEAPIWY